MTRSSAAASILVLALAAAACSSQADTSDLSDENVATAAAALNTGLGAPALAGISSNDPAAAAAAVAASHDGKECRTRSLDPTNPDVVHVVLDDCTGLLGRRHLSGTLTLTFSAGQGGALHVELTSDSLTLDGLAATHQASADITIDGDTRHVTWHGVWTHVRRSGEEATHTGDHTIDLDTTTGCRTVNGTGVTHVGDRQIDSSVTSLTICEGPNDVDSCPTGTIAHDNLVRGRKVLETFDGSDVATVQVSTRRRERTRTVVLGCGSTSKASDGSSAGD